MKRALRIGLWLVALGATLATRPARAIIVERVVAVVGERPILLSELRQRARPHLFRIVASNPTPAQQAAAETEMFRELLNRMVNERLEEAAADKARLSVTPEEVDRALSNVAAQANLTLPQLYAEARRQGLSEQDYRDEIRHQIMEGKLIELRVKGRVRVTEQDARAAYSHWVREMGKQSPKDVRILALRIPAGSVPGQSHVDKLAAELVARARAGEDFCQLVAKYSDDEQTRDKCGSRGPVPMNALLPALADAVAQLNEGEVAEPVRIGADALVVVQLHKIGQIPRFDEVRDQMTQRAYGEAMDRARRQWLDELKRTTYVDVRL